MNNKFTLQAFDGEKDIPITFDIDSLSKDMVIYTSDFKTLRVKSEDIRALSKILDIIQGKEST